MKKPPLITCYHCQGSGNLPLSNELWETLQCVTRHKEVSCVEVAKLMNWVGHATAFNNRLKYLMDLGFLKRHKVSKEWRYSPIKQ